MRDGGARFSFGRNWRSFDVDAESVAAAELRSRFASDGHWTIERGSVLDERFVRGLGRFDIVYAWGVVHHTGDLWRAMDVVSGRSRVTGNNANISGGGLYNGQGGRATVLRSTFDHNTAGSTGGGIFNEADSRLVLWPL